MSEKRIKSLRNFASEKGYMFNIIGKAFYIAIPATDNKNSVTLSNDKSYQVYTISVDTTRVQMPTGQYTTIEEALPRLPKDLQSHILYNIDLFS